MYLYTGDDGISRCWWSKNHPDYIRYHDDEWGHPVDDDIRFFEKLCLEGFQSGLSWLTILRKRENFRKAFAGFDFAKVARFNDSEIEKLLQDKGIVRNLKKIEATINNAQRKLEIISEFESFSAYIWQWGPGSAELQSGNGDCAGRLK